MGLGRRLRLIPGRRGLLLWLLAAMLSALAVSSGNLSLSYGLTAARQALREGDTDRALDLLQQYAPRGAKSSEWQQLYCRALRRAGYFVEAEKQLELAKDSGWSKDDLRREELLLKARRGQVKKVERELVALLESGPTDEAAEEIYEAMSQGYWASYFVEDALQCLEFWINWQPDNLVPRLWIADLFERTERDKAAIAEYREIIEIDPQNGDALAKLGKMLLRKLEVDEAAQAFSQSLAVAPDTADALLGLADCRRRQGMDKEVKALLYDALTVDLTPVQAAEALGTLGALALEDHDYARAAQMLQQSVSLDPNMATTYVSLAAAFTALGQEDLAAAARQKSRDTSDRSSRLQQVTRRVVSEPANAELRCEAGLILIEQGFWPEGADWIKTAIEIDPKLVAAHDGLAKYYEHVGDLEQAKRHRSLAEQAARTAPARQSNDG